MVSPGWSSWSAGESEAQGEEKGALSISESLAGQGLWGWAPQGLLWGLAWGLALTGKAWARVLLPGLCPILGAGGRPLQALAAQSESGGVSSPFGRGTRGLPFRLPLGWGVKLSLSGPWAQGVVGTGAGQPHSAQLRPPTWTSGAPSSADCGPSRPCQSSAPANRSPSGAASPSL